MKLLASLILSASLLCGQTAQPNQCIVSLELPHKLICTSDTLVTIKPHRSHRKLYIALISAAATSFASYEYAHAHRSPMAPTLPFPPQPSKPVSLLITCGVCNSKAN